MLHRKISFRDYKKVGVSIYMTEKENIKNIFDKVGLFPDFIHIDIVDASMNKNVTHVTPHRIEVIKAFWQKHPIETHIMSMNQKV